MRKIAFTALLFLFLAANAKAVPVSAIEVTGNRRVDAGSVGSYLKFKLGDEVDQAAINASIKALFATELYSDVSITENAGKILVELTENPIISQVAFEGNKNIEDDALEKETTLKSRSIYTKAMVQEDVQRVANIYRKSGRFNAKIVPKVVLKDQNRIDLIYEIEEGAVTRIKKIDFIGNKAFSQDELQKVVRSIEESWLNIFTSDDSYDPDRIDYDKELLRRFYAKSGYPDFRVDSATAEKTIDEDGFVLTFAVSEGDKYRFGDINVFSTLEDLKFSNEDEKTVRAEKGEFFDETKVEKSVENIIELAGKKGYAFVDVDPQQNKHEAEKIIDIDFVLNEGPKVYVDRVNINGNTRTLDKVIRREFRLAEGDPYNSDLLKRTKQRIENLGFFSEVNVKRQQGSAPDKVDIDVDVKEKSTGEVNFGAGFSSTDGILGDITIAERNLLGRGQNLRLNLTASARRQQGQISFTEPYFLDEDIAGGFDLYRLRSDQQSESSYTSNSTGLNLRTGYEISEHLRHLIKYGISQDEISDVDPTASLFVRLQEGQRMASMLGQVFTYDTRDNIKSPKEGYVVKATQDFAGLGGDVKFFRHQLETAYYYPLTEEKDWFLAFDAEGGNVTGFGAEDVPINDRYFIGDKSMRGFARSGIGPRDNLTRDAVGGNNYYKFTSELNFPLNVNDDIGLTGAFFSDIGNLWGTDANDPSLNIVDKNTPRVSVGVGVGWDSPFGPLRLDFAFPVVKEDLDEQQNFHLNFGTNF